jgi:hypothetical protein
MLPIHAVAAKAFQPYSGQSWGFARFIEHRVCLTLFLPLAHSSTITVVRVTVIHYCQTRHLATRFSFTSRPVTSQTLATLRSTYISDCLLAQAVMRGVSTRHREPSTFHRSRASKLQYSTAVFLTSKYSCSSHSNTVLRRTNAAQDRKVLSTFMIELIRVVKAVMVGWLFVTRTSRGRHHGGVTRGHL